MRQAGRAGHGVLRLGYIGALLGVIVMVGVVMPPLSAVRAATLTVTTCANSGAGSLPAVFAAAAANDTITFAQDCTGATAIALTATLTPTVNVIIDATTPLHAVTIDGTNSVRLFLVNSGITLGLRGLTLTNGRGISTGGLSGLRGGAIHNLGGAVNIADCTFSTNSALFGGAIVTTGGTVNIAGSAFSNNRGSANGGAILLGGGSTVNVAGSTFSGNSSATGGALENNGGTLSIVGSTFSNNIADGNPAATSVGAAGGAIYNTNSGTLRVTGSTFYGNTSLDNGIGIAGSGGAISSVSGTVSVVSSTFAGNVATGGRGGAINNSSTLILNTPPTVVNSTLTVVNSTFSGNTAGDGGAIFNIGVVNAVGSTFSGNTAGDGGAIFSESGSLSISLRLALSVVAGNTAPLGPDISRPVTTDGGGNVIGTTAGTGGFTDPTDRLNVTPLLAPLALYAPGAVQTFAPLPGSPAIDIAPCPIDPTTGVALATDARGIARPQGAKCDAGAFESRGFIASAPTGSGQNAFVNTAFASPVGLTVSSAFNESVAGGQITFTITPGAGGASATFPAAGGCTLTSATVAVCPIGATGSVASPSFTANGGAGTFTVVASAYGVPPTTFTESVTVLTLTGLTVTPATRTLRPGATYTLTPVGTYSNGTSGAVSGLTYMSSIPTVADVDATTGLVTALAPGQTIITVTAPNGIHATMTVTVTSATGTGLMAPAPAPITHATPVATAAAPPAPQPAVHAAGNGTGSNSVQPQVGSVPTATPDVQPGRH